MPSRLSEEIPPFLVMDVLERAQEIERADQNVIHMEVGEPDFDTPPAALEAGIRALRDGKTHYTHSLGVPELRAAIAEWQRDRYGIEVSEEQVIVTTGTSAAMLLIFAALLDPGDEVILTDPHYACYPNFVLNAGGQSVFVPISAENGYQPEPDHVKRAIADRTKAILVNSPANPTGAVLERETFGALAGLGVPIISDEIYHGLVYEGCENSIFEFTDRAFCINGFSKLFAMTGWRLGYCIVPPEFVRPIQKLQQNLIICASDFAQYAALAAIQECETDVERMVRLYAERREFLVPRLRSLGLDVPYDPAGAFYALANAGHLDTDSHRLAFDILEKAHVAVTPGVDFGSRAEGCLRFSYTNSLENLKEGVERLEQYLAERTS